MNLLLRVDLHKVGRCLECNELTLLSLRSRRTHKAFYEAGSRQEDQAPGKLDGPWIVELMTS